MTVLIALLSLLIVIQLVTTLFLVRANKKIASFESQVIDTFSATDKEPSPAAKFIENSSDIFARSIVAKAQAVFMARQSAQVRGQKAIDGDIAQDLLGQSSPLVDGIIKAFPSVGKSLRRNPGLADYAIQQIAAKIGQPAQAKPSDNGHEQSSFSSEI